MIWTQSTELHYPLPISADIGLSGRAFVDIGGLTEASFQNTSTCREATGAPCVIVASAGPARRRWRRAVLAYSVRFVER